MNQIGCTARCAAHNIILDPTDTWCWKCEPNLAQARRIRTPYHLPEGRDMTDQQFGDLEKALEVQAARTSAERN